MPPTKKKISQLPPADLPLSGTEIIEVVQGGVNKNVPVSEVGGNGGGEQQTVKVLNVHTSGVGNVGTAETVLDEHVFGAVLENDGENLYGNFYFSFIGNSATIKLKLYLINNGVTATIFDTGNMSTPQTLSNFITFDVTRIDTNTVKSMVRITNPSGVSSVNNRFLNTAGLDLSLPVTLQVTGTAAGSGAASDKITAQFSKIFWSATA